MTYDPHKNTTEVRQADKHKTNFRVLILSIGAVVVLFGIIYVIYSMQSGTLPPA